MTAGVRFLFVPCATADRLLKNGDECFVWLPEILAAAFRKFWPRAGG